MCEEKSFGNANPKTSQANGYDTSKDYRKYIEIEGYSYYWMHESRIDCSYSTVHFFGVPFNANKSHNENHVVNCSQCCECPTPIHVLFLLPSEK